MDFLIYLGVLVVIGAFYFINNFTKGNNAILFVIVFSILGMLLVVNDPPEIIKGTNSSITFSGSTPIGATSVFITEEFTVLGFGTTNFFILVYMAFLILAIIRLMGDNRLDQESVEFDK